MKVKDLMSTNIVCVSESTPALQIAGHMRKNNIGSLPVCDQNNHIKGIITDRDLTLRVLARYETSRNADAGQDAESESKDNAGKSAAENSGANAIAEMTAADVMTTNPVVVSPNTNIHDAALLFSSHQVRRLPVMEASKVVGMLSLGDIAKKPIYIDEAGDALSAISASGSLPAES